MNDVSRLLRRESVAVILALVLVGLALVPPNGAAAVELTAVLVAPALVLVVSGTRGGGVRPSRATVLLTCLFAGVALLSVVRGAFAGNPAVSLFGVRGQHTGAVLWLALASVFAVLALTPERGRLVPVARAVGAFSGLLGITALVDFVGQRRNVLFAVRIADSPSGLMENSISLAQVLVLGLGAAVLWSSRSRGTERRIAMGFALLSAAGLIVSRTTSAFAGVAVAAVLMMSIRMIARRRSISRRTAIAIVTGGLLLAFVATWGFCVMSPDAMLAKADVALSSRPSVWKAAFTKAAEFPVVGFGHEQFSAWVRWGVREDGALLRTSTYDPHNVFLSWLIALGVPGLLGVGALVAIALERVLTALALARYGTGMLSLSGAFIAWAVMLSFSWTSPLAAFSAVVLLAAITSELDASEIARDSTPRSAEDSTSSRADADDSRSSDRAFWERAILAVSIGSAVACLALLVAAAPTLLAGVRWARAIQSKSLTPELLLRLAQQSHDPAFASDAMWALKGAPSVPQGSRATVLALLERDDTWSVDAALSLNVLRFDEARADPEGDGWTLAKRALDAGRRASPSSGFWDYLLAVEADALGRKDEARAAAREALAYPVTAEVRSQLEALARTR